MPDAREMAGGERGPAAVLTYVLVVIVEILVVAGLWIFGRHFGAQ